MAFNVNKCNTILRNIQQMTKDEIFSQLIMFDHNYQKIMQIYSELNQRIFYSQDMGRRYCNLLIRALAMYVKEPQTVRGMLVNALYNEYRQLDNPLVQYYIIKAMKIVTLNKNEYLRDFTQVNSQGDANIFISGLLHYILFNKEIFVSSRNDMRYADMFAHIIGYKVINVNFRQIQLTDINFFRFLFGRFDVHSIVCHKLVNPQKDLACLVQVNHPENVFIGSSKTDFDIQKLQGEDFNILVVQGSECKEKNDLQSHIFQHVNSCKSLAVFGTNLNTQDAQKSQKSISLDISGQKLSYNWLDRLVTLCIVQCVCPELSQCIQLLNLTLSKATEVPGKSFCELHSLKRFYALSSVLRERETWEDALQLLFQAGNPSALTRVSLFYCSLEKNFMVENQLPRLLMLEIIIFKKSAENKPGATPEQILYIRKNCIPKLELLHTDLRVGNSEELTHVPFILEK